MRLLASAIAGRPIEVAAVTPGTKPWTDGRTIYADDLACAVVLASLIDPAFPLPPMDLSAARASVDVRRSEKALRKLLGVSSSLQAKAPEELVEAADAAGDGYVGNLFDSPVGKGGVLGKLLARLLRPTRNRDGGGPAGADAATHFTRRAGRGGDTVVNEATAAAVDAMARTRAPGSFRYPEWDVHRARYRPDHCTVVESDRSSSGCPAGGGTTGRRMQTAAMRRELAKIHLGLTPVHRRRRGDDIDIDAAVDAFVDQRTGHTPNIDTYVESVRAARDLSVFVLLDVSGSAAEPGVDGKSIHDHQVATAVALTRALHELGDRVALATFNSRGRHAVQFDRVKSFDERLDTRLAERVGAIVPGAYTRLGAAIRHATAITEAKAGTARRLLVVISDGFAYDHGYEGAYGEADAARALLEARRRGLGCLCLSTGADADTDALSRVFGPAAHANVPVPERLAPVIARLVHDGLRTAERNAA